MLTAERIMIGRDDCDEELDEPSAEDIARRYVEEHARVEDEQD